LKESVVGLEGGEKGLRGDGQMAGNPTNRVKRKAPNGEFRQGTVICGRLHGEGLKRENSFPTRFAKDSLENPRAAVGRLA